MKKTLIAALVCLLAVMSAKAQVLFYDTFTYPNGSIVTNSSGAWTNHSGTTKDSLVSANQYQVFGGGATSVRFDDVNRKFTNATTVTYASFSLNCSGLPTAAGAYFAHFKDTTTSNFYCRVFALAGTNLSLPGTYRLGIAGLGATPSVIFPVDLATNTDYQVVFNYDAANLFGTLWVSPANSGDLSVSSGDVVTNQQPISAFAFRQNTGEGLLTVDNLAVGLGFSDVATNAVVAPGIATQPQGYTNYVGNPATIYVVASGQGLAGFTYQWQLYGTNIVNPAGNTNVLTISSLAATDDGPYTVQVSNSGGTTTSASAYISVNTSAVSPIITTQPTNTTVFPGQNATFTVVAGGPGPLSYQWNLNGSPISGANSSTYVATDVTATNGLTGTYEVDVINSYGTTPSASVTLAVTSPPVVSIGFLRELVDGTFFLPTNTTAIWTTTGIVTTYTNLTTAGSASFWIQDGTGGINVFIAGGNAPLAGDSVTVTGPLSQFNSLLEMNLSAADPSNGMITNSHNNLLPAGVVLPFTFTNSAAFGGISNAIRLYQSAVVTLTNVYFIAGFTNGNFGAGGLNYIITNSAGMPFVFRADARVGDLTGKPVPKFAWSVTGPMSFFLGATTGNRSGGYEIEPTRYIDIVTTPPTPATAAASIVAGHPVLTWTATPYTSYSILASSSVTGPYLPLVAGLEFNTTAGTYTDTTAVSGTRFYKIASP